jgi:hypothetical protein
MGADASLESLEGLEQDSFDVVIDATGAIPMMAKTLDYVRHGGTVLLFGVPPAGKQMEIEPFKIFRKGLKVLSSYTSVRNSYQAVDLLRSGKVDVGPLLSHQLALEDFPRGMNLIETRMEGVRKIMISRTDLQPRREIIFDKEANIATDVRYGDFKPNGGIMFPSVIQISRPQEEYSITLGVLKLTVNQPLTDAQFTLNQPASAQVIRLDNANGTRAADGNPQPNGSQENGATPK